MAVKWWQWKHIQERLRLWGQAVQGTEPYRIEFDNHPGLTGLTDFSARLIRVNPELIPGLKPRDGYQMTKAVLCHEAGHRRFTTPTRVPSIVHMVSNILEDQRIESLMMAEFAGTRPLILALTRALYDQSPELEPTDDPGQVVAAALQHRWAVRLDLGLKGGLSAHNQELWELARPMVEAAWVADDTREVDRQAARIVSLLGLKRQAIPRWVLDTLDRCAGSRGHHHRAEVRGAPSPAESSATTGPGMPEGKDFDGELVPQDHVARSGSFTIEPMPYADLENRALPLARELVAALELEPVDDAEEPAERGGRLSARQYLRDRERPFLVREAERLTPPTLALRVVIDHSTSMNYGKAGRSRIVCAAEAAMVLHLASTELGYDHAVSLMPEQLTLAGLTTGERGKALIAGIVPALTGWEDLAVAIRTRSDDLVAASADIRLVFVLHDGYPNDADAAAKLCRDLRGRVEVIGVLLDPDEGTSQAMREIFGADRLVACSSQDLPRKLATMLEAIRST